MKPFQYGALPLLGIEWHTDVIDTHYLIFPQQSRDTAMGLLWDGHTIYEYELSWQWH